MTATNPFNDAARRLYRRRGYHDAGLDPFISGYTYWDRSGRPHRDAELYVYLGRTLPAAAIVTSLALPPKEGPCADSSPC